MKRTTVFLDESLERRLKQRARRDGKSFAQCVREAVAAYVATPSAGPRPLPSWVGMFSGGPPHDTSERVDEIIAEVMRRKGPHS
jgi:hypothetical protein